MAEWTTYVLTDVKNVREFLKAYSSQNKFNEQVASQCRAVINNQVRQLVTSNYVHNALLGTVNSQKMPGSSTPDKGQKYYVFATNAQKQIGGFASCILQTETKGSLRIKVAYLDVICSANKQGRYIMNTAIWVAKAFGADIMRLSALPQVIGYYRDKFGFTRHPAACYPDVPYRTFKRKRENLDPWQMPHLGNIITSKLFQFGKHRDSSDAGYSMSLCLQRLPMLAKSQMKGFATADVNWNSKGSPKIIKQHYNRLNTTNLPNYYIRSKL